MNLWRGRLVGDGEGEVVVDAVLEVVKGGVEDVSWELWREETWESHGVGGRVEGVTGLEVAKISNGSPFVKSKGCEAQETR